MRTTIRLDDDLLNQARKEAERKEITLTALIDRAIRQILAKGEPGPPSKNVSLPVSRSTGGTLPGVDLNDAALIAEIMDGRG